MGGLYILFLPKTFYLIPEGIDFALNALGSVIRNKHTALSGSLNNLKYLNQTQIIVLRLFALGTT